MGTTTCFYCREPVPNVQAAWRRVSGWEKPRAQGGGHGLTGREPSGEYACDACMRKIARGEDPTAQAMF